MTVTNEESSLFRQAMHSLRLFRKASLIDEDSGQNLIDELYVDLFRDNRLIEEFKRDNTAFLIGRRGTGKSTVFEKAQFDLQKEPRTLCAYVDVQPVSQVAEADYVRHDTDGGKAFSERIRWSQIFLRRLTDALIEDIAKKAAKKWSLQDPLGASKRKREQTQEDIKELFEKQSYITELDISPFGETTDEIVHKRAAKANVRGNMSATAAEIGGEVAAREERLVKSKGGQQIVRAFDFDRFAGALRKAVSGIGVRRVIIFVDDYSELELSAQQVLMDNVIYPLETASGEFVKFKIAAYPGKFYTGKLDAQKIDKFWLDVSAAYFSLDESSLEREASDYVRRLLNKRLEHFCSKSVSYFFDGEETIFRLLYHASFCNPRALGHILDYCALSHLSRGRRITAVAIRDAARKYYEDKLEPALEAAPFVNIGAAASAELASSKLLVRRIVEKARGLKNNRMGQVLKNIKDPQLPTSHFHTREECDEALKPLMHMQILNFYRNLKNKDGEKINVYALNYGLCGKEDIRYGKPGTAGNEGKYYQERCFNYTDIVRDAQNSVEVYLCGVCHETFDVSDESKFEIYGFACPKCKSAGALSKRNMLDDGHQHEVEDPSSLVDPIEYDFMRVLQQSEKGAARAKEIAEEIDVSSQLAGQIGKRLDDKGFVKRREFRGARIYSLTSAARTQFFGGGEKGSG
jgi:hypothetical protein